MLKLLLPHQLQELAAWDPVWDTPEFEHRVRPPLQVFDGCSAWDFSFLGLVFISISQSYFIVWILISRRHSSSLIPSLKKSPPATGRPFTGSVSLIIDRSHSSPLCPLHIPLLIPNLLCQEFSDSLGDFVALWPMLVPALLFPSSSPFGLVAGTVPKPVKSNHSPSHASAAV